MEILRVALLLALVTPSPNAQRSESAPPPSNDGVAIDQGIACVLMLVALALTYIVHCSLGRGKQILE